MFFVSGVKDGLYYVTDTKDGVTEPLDFNSLIRAHERVSIGGIGVRKFVKPNESKYYVKCNSDNAVVEFINSIKMVLARLKLMNTTDKSTTMKQIYEHALSYGLVVLQSDIAIDLDNNSLYLKKLGYVYEWEDTGKVDIVQPIDMRSTDAVKLSRLGEGAFKYLYLTVGSKRIILEDLLKEVSNASWGFGTHNIRYIGITPSNCMFKICLSRGHRYNEHNLECYSVQFNTVKYLISNFDKIMTAKVETASNFKNYVTCVRDSCRAGKLMDDDLVVVKMSKKSNRSVRELKEKYSTLHDVYICERD